MSDKKNSAGLKDFPFTYWVVIIFEFFERGAYYGVMSILSVYLTDSMGFTKESVGVIKGVIQPLLYFLPIITGAIADRMGYRKTLFVAFSLLGLGYLLTSQMTSYSAVFISLVVMGFGAGTFKPVISGTIARVTDERTSTLGFGIFYWTINLGAFLFPLIIVPMLKAVNPSYVLVAAAIATGAMLIPTVFMYKDPFQNEKKPEKERFWVVFKDIFGKIALVFSDWKFILFIFIYSWFWILYFQMFDSVLWYVQAFVDATPLNNFINNTFGTNWYFDVEHVTVINAATIILLQLFISNIVKNTKALPTMIAGIAMGTIGMAILAINSNIWVFIIGIFIFSVGEMTAHPKFISYLGLIAPKDKKATYMGFGFLYGVFGSSIGSTVGAFLYVLFIDNPMIEYIRSQVNTLAYKVSMPDKPTIDEALQVAEEIGLTNADVSQYAHTSELWLLFSGIGVICIIGLLLYNKYIGVRVKAED
jgi:dipeptide/tripeptide permease